MKTPVRRRLPHEEMCREWVEDKHDRCGARADAILWGKLFPPEALGPRCENHAAEHCSGRSLHDIVANSWAVYDLRPINAMHDSHRVV